MRKTVLVLNNKEYERNGISAGDYESFCDIKAGVDPDGTGDYSKSDLQLMREGLTLAYGNQFSAEELKNLDTAELIYQFLAVDAMVATGLKEKMDKLKADFGIGE